MGHDSNLSRQAGTNPDLYADFVIGQRVMTCDGISGVVIARLDGPAPQTEAYEVTLDNGLGGGQYGVRDLSPLDTTTASRGLQQRPSFVESASYTEQELRTLGEQVLVEGQHLASDDYPELSEILLDRPPLAHSEPLAMFAHLATRDSEDSQADDYPFEADGDDDSGEDDSGDDEDDSRSARKTAAIPLVCGDCGQTYFTDSLDEKHGCTTKEAGAFGDIFFRTVDKATGYIDERYPGTAQGDTWSYDWCRFRRDRHCWYPRDFNMAASQQMGYTVWNPFDRGQCWRDKWEDQKNCPVAAPGPKSGDRNALTDATVPWEVGGQRGGVVIGGLAPNVLPFAAHGGGCQGNALETLSQNLHTDGIDRDITQNDPIPEWGVTNVGDLLAGWLSDGTLDCICGLYDHTALLRGHLQVEAAFEFTAQWAEVRAKAKRIRTSGGINVLAVAGDMTSGRTVAARVQGDHGVYDTSIVSEPGKQNVALWQCSCPWATYSWGRSGRWKKYEGRMCAHALALSYEVQARGMFGKNVVEDAESPSWAVAASLHQVDTDGWLAASPAARMAAEMLSQGFDAHRLTAHFGAKVVHEAVTMNFKDRLVALVRGTVRKVREIITETATAVLDDGTTVSVSELIHPDYDPAAGLIRTGAVDDIEDSISLWEASPGDDPADSSQGYGLPVDPEEPGGAMALLHDEPEPALPTTDGMQAIASLPDAASREWLMKGSSTQDNVQIAEAARATLEKMALKTFSPAEQNEIINEGEGVTAANLDRLDIVGTHYEDLDEQDDDSWFD